MEDGISGFRDEIVDAMAQLVEELPDLVVVQEAGFGGCGLGEVADQCCYWIVACAILLSKTLRQISGADQKSLLVRTGCRLKFATSPYLPARGKRSRYR